MHRLWIVAILLSLLTPPLDANEGRETISREAKPTVYNHIGKGSDRSVNAKAKALYRGKFTIVDFSDNRGYSRSMVTKELIPRPVFENGRSVKGDVRVVVVVNQEGRALMPFVVHSTNPKLNQTVLNVITQWRGTPARLNGTPIAVLLHQDFTFK